MSVTWKQWEGRVVDGEFPLQRYLGGSHHSAVFLTQRVEGDQTQKAAIKLTLADPDKAEDQLFRWKLAAKLPHPGLVLIFNTGRSKLDDTELLYIVLEYADEDLSQILPQRALSPEETREMLSPTLDALAYVHSKGFVHGSIRPSNVMAVGDQVKLSSDSLCALPTATGARTSRYAAPEAGPITPAGDVWSLGMTMVEALTQRLPVADRSRSETVVLPDGLQEPFLGIASRCLQADPLQRGTIAEIAAQLKSPLARTGEASAPATRTRHLPARWPYLVAAATVALIALLWASGRKTPTSTQPDRPAQAQPNPAPSASSPQPVQAKPSPVTAVKPAPAQSAEPGNPAAAPPVSTAPPPTTHEPDVTPGAAGDNATPGVVHAVTPTVPRRARNTIHGRVKVRVRVRVDTSGNVASAAVESPGPSKYFAHLALEAAQGWKFAPAQAHGQSVGSEWILRFAFTRGDTEVVPEKTSP